VEESFLTLAEKVVERIDANKELMNESITADLFTALDMVIMEHLDDRCFGIVGMYRVVRAILPDVTSEEIN